jgi:hypothetical protein
VVAVVGVGDDDDLDDAGWVGREDGVLAWMGGRPPLEVPATVAMSFSLLGKLLRPTQSESKEVLFFFMGREGIQGASWTLGGCLPKMMGLSLFLAVRPSYNNGS